MEGDQIVKNAEKKAEFNTIYTEMRDKWQKEEVARKAAMQEEEKKGEEEKEEEPDENTFRNILEGREELNDEKMQEMMTQWMQEAGQMEEMNQMMSAWGNVWTEDNELKMAKDPNVLNFQTENPYMTKNTE